MLYILTGVAKAGKTLISSEVLKNYNISIFSTDYIMMMLSKGNSDLDIDTYASDSTVAKKIEPYLYGMIETMIQNDATYLIEGVHFNTDFSKRLQEQFGNKIKILYIGYKNIPAKEKVKEVYKYRESMDNPWLFDHKGEKVEDIIQYLIGESQRIYEECQDYNLNYIEVYDINQQLQSILEFLIEQ